MIFDALPDIPRAYTAIAEWSACLVYLVAVRRRFSVKTSVVLGLGALGAIVAAQALAGSMPLSLWTLGMMLAVVVMFGFVWLAGALSARESIYIVARAFILAEFAASLEWQLHTYFFNTTAPSVATIFLLIAVFGVVFGTAWFIERRHFNNAVPLIVDHGALATSVATVALTFVMSNMSFISTNTPVSGRVDLEIFYIRTLVDAIGFAVLYAQQGQRLELRRAVEVAVMDGLLRNQHEQYLLSKENIEQVNRKYHDLKNHIYAIRAETNDEARAAYVDQLENSIQGYETAVLDTGNTVLDAVVTAKRNQAALRNIELTCVADGAKLDFVDVIDLCTLVGNALDNAIEAAAGLPDEERRLIRLAVFRQDRFAMMRVENYYEGDLTFVDGMPATTKSDPREHGYGLKNMRQAAERYGGSLTLRADDHWFTMRVLLPIPESH